MSSGEKSRNKVRLIALAPVGSGKTAVLGEVMVALRKQLLTVTTDEAELNGPNQMLPQERLNDLNLYQPEVELLELNPYQAISFFPAEFRKAAEELALNNPSEATKAMLREHLQKLQGFLDDARTWTALQ